MEETQSKMTNTVPLYNYLYQKIPNKISYDALFNVCHALFCTLSILPEDLQSLVISKEVLAETFSKLAQVKNVYSIPKDDIRTQTHWVNQIRAYIIIDKWPNIEKAKNLIA